MSHEQDAGRREALSAYVDGQLDAVSMAAVDRGLRSDPDMADEMAVLRRQNDDLRDWAKAVGDRPLPEGVRSLLRRARQGRTDRPAITGMGWVLSSGAVLCAAGAGDRRMLS